MDVAGTARLGSHTLPECCPKPCGMPKPLPGHSCFRLSTRLCFQQLWPCASTPFWTVWKQIVLMWNGCRGSPEISKNNWRRRANGVLRAVTAAARGDFFVADSLGDWLQQVPLTHSWCQPRLNWSTFMREPPLLPWVTFKVSTCQAFLREPMVKVLALCRRVWHQNMLYQMFAEPILSHVVGVVGQSTKAGTRICGDFRTLKSVPGLRFCPCWAASLSNEILVQNYQNLWWDEFRNSQQTLLLIYVTLATANPGDTGFILPNSKTEEEGLTNKDVYDRNDKWCIPHM